MASTVYFQAYSGKQLKQSETGIRLWDTVLAVATCKDST